MSAVTPFEDVARHIGRPSREVAAQLSDMSQRGLLSCLKKGDTVKYGSIPFVHGLFEFQIANLDRRMAGLPGGGHSIDAETRGSAPHAP